MKVQTSWFVCKLVGYSWIYHQDPEAIPGAGAGAEAEIKQGKAQGATWKGSWLQPTQFTSQALWASSLPKYFTEETRVVRESWKGREPEIKILQSFLGFTPVSFPELT